MLLADMCVVRDKGEAGLVRVRRAVGDGNLPVSGSGLGCLLDDLVLLRSAALTATAFFGVRRESKVVQLLGGGARV